MRLLKVDMYAKTAWLFKQYASARLITVAHPLSAFRILCCFLRVCLSCTRFERLTLALFTVRCPGPPCVCILRQRVNILDDDFIRIKNMNIKRAACGLIEKSCITAVCDVLNYYLHNTKIGAELRLNSAPG